MVSVSKKKNVFVHSCHGSCPQKSDPPTNSDLRCSARLLGENPDTPTIQPVTPTVPKTPPVTTDEPDPSGFQTPRYSLFCESFLCLCFSKVFFF